MNRHRQNEQAATAADSDAALVQRVRQELDRSCAALDGATQSRLNSMRHAALAQAGHRRGFPLLLPFGGLVTASVLVFAVILQGPSLQPEAPALAPVEDLDLLTAAEDFDFYEEYEFYQWLATGGPGF